MRYKAVFFDLDGTLIDSPKFWEQAYHETLAPLGVTFTREHFLEYYPTGAPLKEWMVWLGIDDALRPQIRDERDRRYEQMLRTQIEWIDGAEKLLGSLKGKMPTAIVTGSHRSYIRAIDERLPLTEQVDYLLTDDDFDNKAHGLRMCIERFGVRPEECIYIGDMPFDEEAATATGIPYLMTPNIYTPGALRNRHEAHTAHSIAEMLTLT